MRYATIIFLFFAFSSVKAQNILIPQVEIDSNAVGVEVPVYLLPPVGATALQLSILWPEEELHFDSIVFSESLDNPGFSINHNVPFAGEVRIVLIQTPGFNDPIKISDDSIGFTLFFTLSDQFSGSSIVQFNPDFQNMFVVNNSASVFANTTDGGVLTIRTTVSSNIIDHGYALKIYPNPTRDQFRVSGLPSGTRSYDYTIIDASGRMVTGGQLMENSLVSSESIPPGVYFLRVNLKDRLLVTPLVIVTR